MDLGRMPSSRPCNLPQGVDIDFVMEEYWRCHPEVSKAQEMEGVKEEEVGKIIKRLAKKEMAPVEGTRIIVTGHLRFSMEESGGFTSAPLLVRDDVRFKLSY